MEVQTISGTVQRFNGRAYYLCGKYYQRKGKRLHREVWKYHNGEIPKGYHVHHADGNRANNAIENLRILPGREHLHEHMMAPERAAESRESIEIARRAASKWHGSEAGLAYHSALGKENWKKRQAQSYVCSFCGREFQTKHIYGGEQNHFCHQNCKASFRRKRLRDENQEHTARG